MFGFGCEEASLLWREVACVIAQLSVLLLHLSSLD